VYFRVAKDELKPMHCIVYHNGKQLEKTCTQPRSCPAFARPSS